MFPETYARTLEELAFLFEDKALAEEATMKVEKQIHHESYEGEDQWMDMVEKEEEKLKAREEKHKKAEGKGKGSKQKGGSELKAQTDEKPATVKAP